LRISLFILSFILLQGSLFAQNLDSLLIELESEMENHKTYDSEKEKRLEELRTKSYKTDDAIERYQINDTLYQEYAFYKFDKALQYLEKNIQIADSMNNASMLNEAKLNMGLLLVASGRYKESIDILNEIHRNSIPEYLLDRYFRTHQEAYSGLTYNTAVQRSRSNYAQLYKAYKDSLSARLEPRSKEALSMKERQYRELGQWDSALTINTQRLENALMGSRDFSLIMYERSLLHEWRGEKDKQKECLAFSAISDIKASVKDNASIGILAMIMFTEGDLDRAHQYINFSYDDAKFYSSQLRFIYIANSMPLITEAYEQKNAKQKKRLQYSLIFITVLASFLLFAVYLIRMQIKRVSEARNKLKLANEKLNKSNVDLKKLYLELSEVDKIKVHYIGTFLNLYSEYIDKLDVYRKLVRKHLSTNRVKTLLKLSESKKIIDTELDVFNKNFDRSFLHIYPNFVSDVNQRLKPEKQIEQTDKDTLNTELRILALLKLGITSSSRIAKILRYSVNTIYNYRAAIKKAALDKENFEKEIKGD